MKKFAIICLILICFSGTRVKGQVVVTSPELSIPLNLMLKAQAKIEASKTFAGVVASMRSVHKFASIVESTRCATEDLRYAIQQLEFTKSAYIQRCDFEVRFNVAVYQLSAIPDAINNVLSATGMESSDRVKIIMDTMDKFERTNKELMVFVDDLKRQITEEEGDRRVKSELDWARKYAY
jgi:hypothetical protein